MDADEFFGINEAYEGISLFEAISKSNNSKSWETIMNTDN
jgi:hypothetical protein